MNQGRNAQGKSFINSIKSKWFNKKVFRQAIAYAINRKTIVNNIYRELGAPLFTNSC